MARRRRDYSYSYSYDYDDQLDRLVNPPRNTITHTLKTIRQAAIRSTIATLEDNRVFNPVPTTHRPVRALNRAAADIVATEPRGSTMGVSSGLSFSDPSRVSLCAKRAIRREVIFAKGAAGGGKRRPPRRTPYSDVSCK